MEAVPFGWSEYLSAEGLSDIAPTGLGMQGGGQSGQDGQLLHEGHEEHSASVALKDDMITIQNQHHHLGSTSNLETSEAGFDPAPPQQAPSPVDSSTKTGPNVSTQGIEELRALVPDQVCTCAACLDGNRSFLPWHGYRNCCSGTFGCRITGCEWATISRECKGPYSYNNLDLLISHEMERSHYGNPGDYRCREANCKITSKRWGDLLRHSSSKHCINPGHFECPVLDCKYHQQGFTRKDKLQSHFQKVHGGKSQPSKPNRAVKPKGGDCA